MWKILSALSVELASSFSFAEETQYINSRQKEFYEGRGNGGVFRESYLTDGIELSPLQPETFEESLKKALEEDADVRERFFLKKLIVRGAFDGVTVLLSAGQYTTTPSVPVSMTFMFTKGVVQAGKKMSLAHLDRAEKDQASNARQLLEIRIVESRLSVSELKDISQDPKRISELAHSSGSYGLSYGEFKKMDPEQRDQYLFGSDEVIAQVFDQLVDEISSQQVSLEELKRKQEENTRKLNQDIEKLGKEAKENFKKSMESLSGIAQGMAHASQLEATHHSEVLEKTQKIISRIDRVEAVTIFSLKLQLKDLPASEQRKVHDQLKKKGIELYTPSELADLEKNEWRENYVQSLQDGIQAAQMASSAARAAHSFGWLDDKKAQEIGKATEDIIRGITTAISIGKLYSGGGSPQDVITLIDNAAYFFGKKGKKKDPDQLRHEQIMNGISALMEGQKTIVDNQYLMMKNQQEILKGITRVIQNQHLVLEEMSYLREQIHESFGRTFENQKKIYESLMGLNNKTDELADLIQEKLDQVQVSVEYIGKKVDLVLHQSYSDCRNFINLIQENKGFDTDYSVLYQSFQNSNPETFRQCIIAIRKAYSYLSATEDSVSSDQRVTDLFEAFPGRGWGKAYLDIDQYVQRWISPKTHRFYLPFVSFSSVKNIDPVQSDFAYIPEKTASLREPLHFPSLLNYSRLLRDLALFYDIGFTGASIPTLDELREQELGSDLSGTQKEYVRLLDHAIYTIEVAIAQEYMAVGGGWIDLLYERLKDSENRISPEEKKEIENLFYAHPQLVQNYVRYVISLKSNSDLCLDYLCGDWDEVNANLVSQIQIVPSNSDGSDFEIEVQPPETALESIHRRGPIRYPFVSFEELDSREISQGRWMERLSEELQQLTQMRMKFDSSSLSQESLQILRRIWVKSSP